ncbi:MAG: sodium-translocating pyrophosphatase [Marine Group III euryarchaeote CG-Bathy1]|uniref:Putative K(+)-stimulated pyrophosphate-energized sodium pump n=1 Tax=Marine Group III euryarchaeote CG-Bathy1 TaxID=1889001 RepID=A0A1J5TZ65_9ARCH|nr:MAG: sodium-translocating pyrophosphatase [Marine Group III euryarchaeote CG-Bathy1]
MEDFSNFWLLAGLVSLGFAFWKMKWIETQSQGTDEMSTIAKHIRSGAMAFLKREYTVLSIFVLVVALLLALGYKNQGQSAIALAFVFGAFCSGLAGFIGMWAATASNSRTTHAARSSLNDALMIAFSGGSVMGMCVAGLGVLGLSLLYLGLEGSYSNLEDRLSVMAGFSLGASSIALFARVGGGIYTKAADVGADLVGKVEAGIPEDDPRNPATIADNVGDNVGDVAGMGADLFESFVGVMIGAMVLAAAQDQEALVQLPLTLAAAGIFVSIIGTFLVRTNEGGNPQTALNKGHFGAAFLMLVVSYFIIEYVVGSKGVSWETSDSTMIMLTPMNLFYATLVGVTSGILIGLFAEYYTSDERAPAQEIARSSETGSATNIISGLGTGMISTALPVITIALAMLFAYDVAHLYGIGIAALGMLSTIGIQLAVDAYGPIADNAGGIAEMTGLDPKVRERTDKLDAVGNTTAAIGKGFAIGSAALTALVLFAAFTTQAGITEVDILNPKVLAGLFIGGMLPFVFAAFSMQAVGEAAFEMIEEVRRQFREIEGLLDGKAEADFARCVDISTQAAIKKMAAPGLLAVSTPVIFAVILPATNIVSKTDGFQMLAGVLAGVTVCGVLMAIFMSNAGGAWDNAKKYIEGGAHGGKGSDAHKAAVVGDTVGDPFKDTAGPSLNILIKLMSVVSLVLAGL